MSAFIDSIFDASKFDEKSLTQKALKLAEECGELAQAVLSYTKAPACAHKGKNKEDVIEEACDCIITAASIIYQVEDGKVDVGYFDRMIQHKLAKWIEKSKKEKKGP